MRMGMVPFAFILLALFTFSLGLCEASEGDRDPSYRACVEVCEKSGCVGENCFSSCNVSANGANVREVNQEPLLLKWSQWDCRSECQYQCMMRKESKKAPGHVPLKYHGKWPFNRILGIQEPASVVFSLLNLLVHISGLSSFLILVYTKLPQRLQGRRGPYYEFVGLWTIYGLLSINAWFWSAIFHTRDMHATERLDYSSAIALLGYSFILAILRTFSIKSEAARVMVSAPIVAFVSTHILYLNFYEFDYGFNMLVCLIMGIIQLVLWLGWSVFTKHPSSVRLWIVIVGTVLAMLFEVFDFPPVKGVLDAHAVWHAITIPLTYIWWGFIKSDASWRTNSLREPTKKVE